MKIYHCSHAICFKLVLQAQSTLMMGWGARSANMRLGCSRQVGTACMAVTSCPGCCNMIRWLLCPWLLARASFGVKQQQTRTVTGYSITGVCVPKVWVWVHENVNINTLSPQLPPWISKRYGFRETTLTPKDWDVYLAKRASNQSLLKTRWSVQI
jgi:hypothetical protein